MGGSINTLTGHGPERKESMKKKGLNVKVLAVKLCRMENRRHEIIGKRMAEEKAFSKQEGEIIEAIKKNCHTALVVPSRDYQKKEILDLRAKISKNEVISKMLGRIPVEKIAIVEIRGEDIRDTYFWGRRSTKTDWWLRPDNLLSSNNAWRLDIRYLCGGPGSPAKAFYRRSKNNVNYLCGFMTDYPLKEGKAA
jgi:hypothetical protein